MIQLFSLADHSRPDPGHELPWVALDRHWRRSIQTWPPTEKLSWICVRFQAQYRKYGSWQAPHWRTLAVTPSMQAGTGIHRVLERYLSVYYWVCRSDCGAGSCLRVGRSIAQTIRFEWLSDVSQNTYIETLLTRRASSKCEFKFPVAAVEYPGPALVDDLWVTGRLRADSRNEVWGLGEVDRSRFKWVYARSSDPWDIKKGEEAPKMYIRQRDSKKMTSPSTYGHWNHYWSSVG